MLKRKPTHAGIRFSSFAEARARTLLVCLLGVIVLPGCTDAPTPGPPAAIPALIRGVVANNPLSFTATKTLSPPAVRVEFPIGTDPTVIAPVVDRLAAQGSTTLLLAGFYQSVPTEDQARSLGAWARAFGPGARRAVPVRTIEFGNETSYTYQYGDAPDDPSYTERAHTYALRVALAAEAIRAADPDVGLLAQADDGGTRSSAWVDSMFEAVPTLDASVVGWVVHPYGPTYLERLSRTSGQLARHKATKPLWITEWGVATDGGRCLDGNYGWNPCMNSGEAANVLRTVVADLARLDVAAFFVYQLSDHRSSGAEVDKEGYFGVLSSDGRTKGDYTNAVRTFLAADPGAIGGRRAS